VYGDSQEQTSGVYALDEDGGLTLLHEYQDGEYSLDDLIEEFGFGRMDGGTENGDEIVVLAPKEIRQLKVNADAYSFDYDEGFIAMCLDIDRFASGNADESLRLVSID
jgi:broad specificity phosphatase PhoE